MKPQRVLTPHNTTELFDRAVAERALAVVTLHDGQAWQTFKARFLERDPRERFIVLDYVALDNASLPPLTPGECVGISFRQRSRKFLFSTVVEAKGHFALDDKNTVAAMRYRWPAGLSELQRRAYYRTPVPEDMTLVASVWAGGVTARASAQRDTLQVLTGNVADLSCGGALITLHQPQPPDWQEGQTLGIEAQLPDGRAPIVIDARYRGTRPMSTGVLSAAVQFIGLELSADGPAILQRLANSVQRLLQGRIGSGRRDWNTNS
jgi:c-di-GMP-binding flagellar brake protein YcgR